MEMLKTKRTFLSIAAGTVKLDDGFGSGFSAECDAAGCHAWVEARMIRNTWIAGLCGRHFDKVIADARARDIEYQSKSV